MTRGLSKNQRSIVAEKVMEWGNLVFIGLVIAQLVPEISPFKVMFFLLGVTGIISAYIIAYFLLMGGE